MTRISRRRLLRSATTLGLGAAIAGCTQQAATVAPAATLAEAEPTTATTSIAPSAEATSAEATTTPEPTAPAAAAAVEYGPEGVVLSEEVPEGAAYMAIVHGESPEAMVNRAIEALGGIGRFVQSGYDVIIKPNICNPNYDNEYASTTNPEVVAALVKLCLGAGAGRVRVMDLPFEGTCDQVYYRSGIQAAVEAAGGEMEVMAPHKYVEVPIPGGKDLRSWEFYPPGGAARVDGDGRRAHLAGQRPHRRQPVRREADQYDHRQPRHGGHRHLRHVAVRPATQRHRLYRGLGPPGPGHVGSEPNRGARNRCLNVHPNARPWPAGGSAAG